jgi:uncharacterized damage-inducible protein DinB
MNANDPKAVLQRYLQRARDAVVWKLEGLSEYDARRPLVLTSTNLLGLVKHLTGIELGYLGATFGRPSPDELPFDEDDPLADLFATAAEPRESIIGQYQRAWEHADATIAELDLDATGHVPWWPEERNEVTLHTILVHVIAETNRHAGHADVVRELIDGTVGLAREYDNLGNEKMTWQQHWDRVEQAARDAGRS